MPNQLPIPPELQHLIEKRSGKDRRKSTSLGRAAQTDAAQAGSLGPGSTSGSAECGSIAPGSVQTGPVQSCAAADSQSSELLAKPQGLQPQPLRERRSGKDRRRYASPPKASPPGDL